MKPSNLSAATFPEGDPPRAGPLPNTPSAKVISKAVVLWLQGGNNIVATNVHILGSPWESDVIKITAAYYWHEYEIKLSVTDFRADFRKRVYGFSRRSKRKHEVYISTNLTPDERRIPRPKSFTFVVPGGLLDETVVPSHCGILEYGKHYGPWHVRIKRPAPTLRNPTKLSQAQVFNLARKLSERYGWSACKCIETQEDG